MRRQVETICDILRKKPVGYNGDIIRPQPGKYRIMQPDIHTLRTLCERGIMEKEGLKSRVFHTFHRFFHRGDPGKTRASGYAKQFT